MREASGSESVEALFRLLPSERVLWEGRPASVPRDRRWQIGPALLAVFAAICGLFALLLRVTSLPGSGQTAMVCAYLALTALAIWIAPRFLIDPCQYVVTDRRVIWKRGRLRRSIDRHALTFARIRWHRSVPGVGHLELVRAVPFGPLARKQRLMLHDVRGPDIVLAIVRGVEPGPNLGDAQVALTDRLDPGEQVLWGAGPEGLLMGWREILTSLGGVVVLVVGFRYGYHAARILLELEELGLQAGSATWFLLFGAMLLTALLIVAVGVGLAWHGVWRARAMGRDTDYLLTDRRLLIRRGKTELSLDRKRIVDVAEAPSWRGSSTLFLILDAPEARALADSGALGPITPSRDTVPPILYELRDPSALRDELLRRDSSVPRAA